MTKIRYECVNKETGEVWFQGVSATRLNPCPICHKPTSNREGYCMIDHARGRVWCGHSCDAFQGAFFDLSSKSWGPLPPHVAAVQEQSGIDWTELQDELVRSLSKMELHRQAKGLGVTPYALELLGAGWRTESKALSFPMRNAAGDIIGIRLRKSDGFKFAVSGSKNGLFFAPAIARAGEVFVCEGPTDAAAGLSMELPVVGRASALTCKSELVRLCDGLDVVIIRDHDDAGKRGAEDLARALHGRCPAVRILAPAGAKDLRSWHQKGCTGRVLRAFAQSIQPWEMA